MVNVSQVYAICVKTYMVNVSLVSEVTPVSSINNVSFKGGGGDESKANIG